MQTKRLTPADRDLARATFAMMVDVFGEDEEGGEERDGERVDGEDGEDGADGGSLGDAYLDRLLGRADFWALVALEGDEPVGGITAHALPMTRSEATELFIYDLAVRADRQRKGIGRELVTALREAAFTEGIEVAFVPADDDDTHALDFYLALGGQPAKVTIFDWRGRPQR